AAPHPTTADPDDAGHNHHDDQHDVAAVAVQRAVPRVPWRLPRGAGLHGRPSPGAVRLPVSGAPSESERWAAIGAARAARAELPHLPVERFADPARLVELTRARREVGLGDW